MKEESRKVKKKQVCVEGQRAHLVYLMGMTDARERCVLASTRDPRQLYRQRRQEANFISPLGEKTKAGG